jgi:excisionase family DNA binding protein
MDEPTETTIVAVMILPTPDSEFLRLSEAARFLGVGDTTLKRWTEEGRVPCDRTAGGHRRFRRVEIETFKTRMGGVAPAVAAPEPVRKSDSRERLDEPRDPAEAIEMTKRVLDLRASSRDWAEAGDRLCAGLLTEIGERWSHGPLTCAEELDLSRAIETAFLRVAHAMPVAPGAPTMLLACIEGEQHTLGLSLVETAVRERGMAVRFLGADVPTSEIVKAVRSVRPVAVGLTASRQPRPADDLVEPSRAVSHVCAEVGARLFLGGGGNWPPVRGAQRLLTLMELIAALAPVLPRPATV